MDSGIGVLGLVGVAVGLAVLISLFVLAAGRAGREGGGQRPRTVWFGGPGHGEHGVSDSGLVLLDRRPDWVNLPENDWPALAEHTEPRGRTGGASAGW